MATDGLIRFSAFDTCDSRGLLIRVVAGGVTAFMTPEQGLDCADKLCDLSCRLTDRQAERDRAIDLAKRALAEKFGGDYAPDDYTESEQWRPGND